LDCNKCIDSLKDFRGCKRDSPAGEHWVYSTFSSARCPARLLTDEKVILSFKIYNNYKNGFLPNKGAWLDQPNKVIEIIDTINAEVNKINDRMKKDGSK